MKSGTPRTSSRAASSDGSVHFRAPGRARSQVELRKLFADAATLRDWDVEKAGAEDVVAANGGIFEAVPTISIDVLKVHVSESTLSAIAEIIVNVPDDKLKVTDVITFDAAGLIVSVRAYKG